jgi:hypothetical protein
LWCAEDEALQKMRVHLEHLTTIEAPRYKEEGLMQSGTDMDIQRLLDDLEASGERTLTEKADLNFNALDNSFFDETGIYDALEAARSKQLEPDLSDTPDLSKLQTLSDDQLQELIREHYPSAKTRLQELRNGARNAVIQVTLIRVCPSGLQNTSMACKC